MRVNPKNPGSEKNLLVIGRDLDPVETGRKGGLVRSQAKKDAQRLRAWKEKLNRQALCDKDMAWILEQVNSSKSMAVDMISYLGKLERDGADDDIKTQATILHLKKEIFKAIHGTNVKIDARVVHMTKDQLDEQREEIREHIIDILGEGVEE